jgi:hypothetical protein
MQLLGILRVYIFILPAFILLSCTHHRESVLTKKYAPVALRQDATLLRDVVLAMHPAVGIYQPRSYYSHLFETFIGSLNDSLTEKQFRLKLKLLINELHCGHTEVMASWRYYREATGLKLNYSPYVFLPVEDRLFVIANLNKKQDSTLRKGYEVTQLNNIKVDSVLRYSRRFVSRDGFNETAPKFYVQSAFNSFFLVLFGRPDSFNVEYKKDKAIKTATYRAIKLKSMPPLPLERIDSLLTRYRRAGMKFKYMDSGKRTLYLKLDKFSHRKFGKAYRKTFRRLKKNQSGNLVIDLRGNGGGSLANAYKLLSYLIDTPQTQTLRTAIKNYPYKNYTKGNFLFRLTRGVYKIIGTKKTVNDTDNFIYTIRPVKKNHFNGHVYVLVNGGSFSASCLVSAYLKRRRNTTFIGEETGGAQEGCNAGVTPYYRLPNTGLRIRVPAFRIVHDVSPNITGHGIIPDFPVTRKIEDLLQRKDPELEKTKQLISTAQ